MKKMCQLIVVILYLSVSVIVRQTNGFNLSPKPNIVLREPQLKTFLPKMQTSYFGFSLNLRKNSVIIGAPRAQSSLPSQRMINETGAIYKCLLETQNCEPFVFDNFGNINEEPNQFIYNSEMKDYQWLGASMDGGSLETDRLVVCSPRTLSDITNHHLIHGICYWTPNTTDSKPLVVHKITPLRLRDKQQIVVNKERYYYHMFGEQGISVHITENNEEILIGAPGVYTWKGTIIRHRAQSDHDFGGLSRRDQLGLRTAKRDVIEYTSDVPNPALWKQNDDSYFGYAVSSGYFGGAGSTKLLYVASAPQADMQNGEVYLFDIVDHFTTDKTIRLYYTFPSEQFGSYYGYSLITDDFNGDGFTDIAISAPLYSKDFENENGAVYIYKNQGIISNGKWMANFILDSTLTSDYNGNERFGTTISRIGDINQDGYNDLAVGAPYEDNGAVYIFLGSQNGVITKPSQKITAPFNSLAEPFLPHIFGCGLSKGVDIDNNNYLDLAIGAPNAESVYVYKAYPVIKIKTRATPESKELKTTDSSFMLKTCWVLESKFPIAEDKHLNMLLKVDPIHGRASLENRNNQLEFNVTAGKVERCFDQKVLVKFSVADIFKPIEIELHHQILNTIPNSEEFCENCVAINPNDPKVAKNKLVFNTGCKGEKCIADLRLKSSISMNPLPYVLGSSKTLPIEYSIQNAGETAYLTQINITIPDIVFFAKIPSSCSLIGNSLLCDISHGNPLINGQETKMKILLDTTKLEGSTFVVRAHVFSTGEESNDSDNFVEDIIPLAEFSDIEISGKSSKEMLSLETGLKVENITHIFEIRNNGPTNIKHLDAIFSVPLSYVDPWTLSRVSLINFEDIMIKGQYNNQQLEVEWTQNNTVLLQNPIEFSSTPRILDNQNGLQYDNVKMGLEYDLNTGSITDPSNALFEDGNGRRKRDVRINSHRNIQYNRYTQSIIENHSISRRSTVSTNDIILDNLPVNRTIVFDCYDAEAEMCVKARFSIHNFKVGNVPIIVALNFRIDLAIIDKIVDEKRDIFVIKTSAEIIKMDDESGNTFVVVQSHPFTIITKYLPGTPIWVIIVSVLVGILTLVLITYGLYKAGFFKRTIKEEHEKLQRESIALTRQPDPETD